MNCDFSSVIEYVPSLLETIFEFFLQSVVFMLQSNDRFLEEFKVLLKLIG